MGSEEELRRIFPALGQPPENGSSSRIHEFIRRMYGRAGNGTLSSHLESNYGIQIGQISELDLGVYRVDQRDGPSWVARVFSAARPVEDIQGDADILRFLERHGFPAERCAIAADAVFTHDGQGVLLTEFVAGSSSRGSERMYRKLGNLLGRLHAMPSAGAAAAGAMGRQGGAWHHLAHSGCPREEIGAAKALLTEAGHGLPEGQERTMYETLLGELEGAEDCHDLPHAFMHADLVPDNCIVSSGRGLVVVDWAGAGRGPRLHSLGFLLWAAGSRDPACVDAVVAGYRSQIRLEPGELARLPGAICARPIVFGCWEFCMGRKTLPAVLQKLRDAHELANAIAVRVRLAFDEDQTELQNEGGGAT